MINRVELAERQLDRVQGFHPRIDSKVAAVSAWLILELGIVIANTKIDDILREIVYIPLLVFFVAIAGSGFALWKCLFPDQRGGSSSIIYFARIAERTEANYIKAFHAASDADILDDLLGQIWRNSEIVCDKYRFVSRAIRWATFSLGAMLTQITAVSFVHEALPIWKG